jgi:hypothetical protein
LQHHSSALKNHSSKEKEFRRTLTFQGLSRIKEASSQLLL